MRRQAPTLGPPKRRGRSIRAAAALFLLALAAAGVPHLLGRGLPAPGKGTVADGIVVLTGGEYRIREGYRAWRAGEGRDLAILGAGVGINPERILPGRPTLTPGELQRIYVENWSENTLENAYSAKELASRRKYSRVILVTSRYHLPRAYLTFRKVLPAGVSLSVIPVDTDWREEGGIVRTVRLYVMEGWKYWWYRLFLFWE